MSDSASNLLASDQSLEEPVKDGQLDPPESIFPEDSAVTKAEKRERNRTEVHQDPIDSVYSASKRVKMSENGLDEQKVDSRDKVKGIALVKTEYAYCLPSKTNANNYPDI